jgi:hypothetical protein
MPQDTIPVTTPNADFSSTSAEVSYTTDVLTGPQLFYYDPQQAKAVVYMRGLSQQASNEAEQRFNALAEEWYLDTLMTSSYYEKILHPAYQKILRLDEAAIPLILRELEAMPNDWFWALRILTDDDPVKPEQTGDMQAMAEAWLAWGRQENYI